MAQISNEKPMTKKKKEEKKKMTYLDVAKKDVNEKARRIQGNGKRDRLKCEKLKFHAYS